MVFLRGNLTQRLSLFPGQLTRQIHYTPIKIKGFRSAPKLANEDSELTEFLAEDITSKEEVKPKKIKKEKPTKKEGTEKK